MQKLRAQRPHLLRVFKTRPELGIVFCDTPATAGAPPGPAHQSATALQTSSHDTPPPGAFPGVSSLPLVALDPHCRPVPRSATGSGLACVSRGEHGRRCWVFPSPDNLWRSLPRGRSSAFCVALGAKQMAETCSPRKIGPGTNPLGSDVSKCRRGERRTTFFYPGLLAGCGPDQVSQKTKLI